MKGNISKSLRFLMADGPASALLREKLSRGQEGKIQTSDGKSYTLRLKRARGPSVFSRVKDFATETKG